MLTISVELDSFRRRIHSLGVNNARLRDELQIERSRLQKFQQRSPDRGPSQSTAALRKQLEELTARELEVLRLVAEGRSTKEIGACLGITFKTAACHRHRVMQKLDVHGTGTLVRMAIAAGVVKV